MSRTASSTRTIALRLSSDAWAPYLSRLDSVQSTTGNLRAQSRTPGAPLPADSHLAAGPLSDSAVQSDYVIFSYQTPIAWHVPGVDSDGDQVWITPAPAFPYSRTTSQHMKVISDALSQTPGIYTYRGPQYAPGTYDEDGYDSAGYDNRGFDRYGFNRDGYDSNGYNEDGYDEDGRDSDGYDEDGYDRNGYDRDGRDSDGRDEDGYDRDGYDSEGFDSEGFDSEGRNAEGFDSYGYDRDGYDEDGRDEDGYDSDGRDSEGYDRSGYDRSGYDMSGYSEDGYNEDGYDRDGYDRSGYDPARGKYPAVANELERLLTAAAFAPPAMSAGIAAMSSRITDERTARLAGVAIWPAARQMVDAGLSDAWARARDLDTDRVYREVIIGAGVHAAIYAATRVQRGFAKPLVLERSSRPGGTFALTSRPVFYLNSGNYPGLLGTPGNGEALNYLPGAPLQPSDVTSAQYGTNVDIGFITRLTLAMYADVITGAEVRPFNDDIPTGDTFTIPLADGRKIRTLRVIDARGLGDPVRVNGADGFGPQAGSDGRVITFPDLVKRFDRDWPLMGLKRVAVIGGGDSGKVAAECLLGIGPQSSVTAAALDYVERIDLYGERLPTTAEGWFTEQRSRYSQLGSFLRTRRLEVLSQRATITAQPDAVLVNGRSYDLAVIAAGFTPPEITTGGLQYRVWPSGEQDLGRRSQFSESYRVGPVAMLPFSDSERSSPATVKRDENMAGIFRYAGRTAGLASILPDVTP